MASVSKLEKRYGLAEGKGKPWLQYRRWEWDPRDGGRAKLL